VETAFILGPFGRIAVHHERIESEILISVRLDEVLNSLHRNVALKIETNVLCIRTESRFAPAVFDDAARLDSWHRKRLGFVFQASGLHDGAVEDVFFFEFYDRAVRLDGAPGNVAN